MKNRKLYRLFAVIFVLLLLPTISIMIDRLYLERFSVAEHVTSVTSVMTIGILALFLRQPYLADLCSVGSRQKRISISFGIILFFVFYTLSAAYSIQFWSARTGEPSVKLTSLKFLPLFVGLQVLTIAFLTKISGKLMNIFLRITTILIMIPMLAALSYFSERFFRSTDSLSVLVGFTLTVWILAIIGIHSEVNKVFLVE
ncbi:MAG: hypothetical protein EOP04_01180 [Proteobacteria bacterium]|nr:MAG: hypothetical protein EOP04_01180 [Pseudomonadota bacterium]